MDMKYVILFENGFYYNENSMTYSLSKSKLYSSPYDIDRDIQLKEFTSLKKVKYTIEMVKLKIIK